MGILSQYEPKAVFQYFEDICSMPHGSGNIKQISDYLVQFAQDRSLAYRQDEMGNVIIWKNGTEGYENSEPVIIQGHMDMVAVQTKDCTKDMEKEGLDLEILDGDYISAKGTSLGGDDGIALAYALAILDSNSIAHPPIEAVFTVDEEIGLLGAQGMDCSDLKGRMFLNLDSEEEGIFTISCAGGLTSVGKLPFETEEKQGCVVHVSIFGFKGGHSGAEIHKGRLNSNLVLGRMLNSLKKEAQIITVSGGEKDNAISIRSEVSLLVGCEKCAAKVQEELSAKLEEIANEYESVEGNLQISFEVVPNQSVQAMTKDSTKKVIAALLNHPNGIQRMNPEMPDMVQTSLNLGIVSMVGNEVHFSSSVRSSSETEKHALYERVVNTFEMLGGYVENFGGYPGWEYNPDSKLRDIMIEAYQEQYGKDPIVVGIHAGLECGLFAAKLPGLDAVSIGPEMHDIHTTKEVLGISSTARTYELILRTLAKLK
ncbi:MAG: aminoacyl-histidine dipeptidase [Bacillota bacterium]|nr:aminoacyl-histidine dipeptidase [Bacillota bacterium]